MCIYMAYCIVSMYIILDVFLVVHSFISPFWVCLDLYIYIINIYKNKCTLQFVSHSVHKCACVCVCVCVFVCQELPSLPPRCPSPPCPSQGRRKQQGGRRQSLAAAVSARCVFVCACACAWVVVRTQREV